MHEFILPFGPYHPALKEPEYFKLLVRGEEIIDVDFILGYNYRDIEKIIESRMWNSAVYLVERICSLCGTSHTNAFCLAVEKILNLEIPKRASCIRVIMSEIERIQSHFLFLSEIAHQIGFQTLFMLCFKAREILSELSEQISGGRIHKCMNVIGGVRRDISRNLLSRIKLRIKEIEKETKEIEEIFSSHKIIEKRTKKVGILKKEKVEELGIVGPTARASGVRTDVRKKIPYFEYSNVDFDEIVMNGCDCYSRIMVRIKEIYESLRILSQFEKLPEGNIRVPKKIINVPEEEALSFVEAPRGELIYHVISNGKTPKYVRIRTPTLANVISLKEMLIGSTISDAPVIISSIDPCFSCMDRIVSYDVDTGERRVLGHGHD